MVFEVLSMVFPTIRIWPDSTSSAVIEYLHETLQLFGLHQQVSPSNSIEYHSHVERLSEW